MCFRGIHNETFYQTWQAHHRDAWRSGVFDRLMPLLDSENKQILWVYEVCSKRNRILIITSPLCVRIRFSWTFWKANNLWKMASFTELKFFNSLCSYMVWSKGTSWVFGDFYVFLAKSYHLFTLVVFKRRFQIKIIITQ